MCEDFPVGCESNAPPPPFALEGIAGRLLLLLLLLVLQSKGGFVASAPSLSQSLPVGGLSQSPRDDAGLRQDSERLDHNI